MMMQEDGGGWRRMQENAGECMMIHIEAERGGTE
jgi:hypothetical protein